MRFDPGQFLDQQQDTAAAQSLGGFSEATVVSSGSAASRLQRWTMPRQMG